MEKFSPSSYRSIGVVVESLDFAVVHGYICISHCGDTRHTTNHTVKKGAQINVSCFTIQTINIEALLGIEMKNQLHYYFS